MNMVGLCSIEDCGKLGRLTRGMCNSHYMRLWRYKDPGHPITKAVHGLTDTPEYKAWTEIKGRCYNPNNSRFHRYGARGIRLCDEWRNDFLAFYNHVGRRPMGRYSIERINNDGHYEPGNVRWATYMEQGSNKGNNRLLTHKGETHTMSEWSRITGIKLGTLWNRLERCGMSTGDALTLPTKRYWNTRP